ncbi:MAG: hypothetical protein HY576_08975 [candidate division NC10 bacterium]|nr:hypothetical protein [candidate division NC10 bacterium]
MPPLTRLLPGPVLALAALVAGLLTAGLFAFRVDLALLLGLLSARPS